MLESRKRDPVGAGVTLGVGFRVSQVQARPGGFFSSCFLQIQMWNPPAPRLPVCRHVPHHEDDGLKLWNCKRAQLNVSL